MYDLTNYRWLEGPLAASNDLIFIPVLESNGSGGTYQLKVYKFDANGNKIGESFVLQYDGFDWGTGGVIVYDIIDFPDGFIIAYGLNIGIPPNYKWENHLQRIGSTSWDKKVGDTDPIFWTLPLTAPVSRTCFYAYMGYLGSCKMCKLDVYGNVISYFKPYGPEIYSVACDDAGYLYFSYDYTGGTTVFKTDISGSIVWSWPTGNYTWCEFEFDQPANRLITQVHLTPEKCLLFTTAGSIIESFTPTSDDVRSPEIGPEGKLFFLNQPVNYWDIKVDRYVYTPTTRLTPASLGRVKAMFH
jgi:hypothetical protein